VARTPDLTMKGRRISIGDVLVSNCGTGSVFTVFRKQHRKGWLGLYTSEGKNLVVTISAELLLLSWNRLEE
jgi:hypothetical protein